MSDDLIDFRCSSLWLNYYHDQGLTPRFDTAGHRQDLTYYDAKIRQLQKEAEALRLADEEWFANQRRLQDVQAQREQIQAKQNETFDTFTGIKAESAWKEEK